MLMEKIAAHRYERRAYDQDGTLTGRALFDISRIVEAADRSGDLQLYIKVERFDDADRSIGTDEVVWSCNPGAARMFMNLLILLGDTAKQNLRLDVESAPLIYPAAYSPGATLEDLVLNIRIKRGILSLLGTGTRLTLSNRMLLPLEASESPADRSGFRIVSDIEAKVYVLRLRVKRRRMRSEEWLDTENGLIRQVVTFSDGSYSEVTQVR